MPGCAQLGIQIRDRPPEPKCKKPLGSHDGAEGLLSFLGVKVFRKSMKIHLKSMAYVPPLAVN